VRFEGSDANSDVAGGSAVGAALPDGSAWVARTPSTTSSTPAAQSPVPYTTYTSAAPIYLASAAPLPTTTVYTASPGPLASTTLPSPATAYGASIGPPPLANSSSASAWDPYRLAQRPAAFSGTITSTAPSGQYLLPQPMPRVPYYTQQPVVAPSVPGQPYVVVPEAPGVAPVAQPGTVVIPGPTPPAMVLPPSVPTLGSAPPPLVPPAPVYPTSCYAEVDAIFFTRDVQAGSKPLVLQDIVLPTTPNVLTSTADLRFPFEVGPRITLGHDFGNAYSFEASYFGIYNWHDSIINTGTNNLNLPDDLGLFPAFNSDNQITITYDSIVNNGELNILHSYGNISCLAGFRYFNLGEHLNIGANNAIIPTTGTYDVNAYNNLFGLQGGARIQQSCGNWSYDLTGKAGVYGNAVSSSQEVVEEGFLLRDSHKTGGQVAFVGELGFNGAYQFSQNWFLRGGYQVFWVDGVALAPNQLDFSTNPTPALNTTGSLFMQGANAGLMARW
jgi:hypothetical protein